MTSTNYYSLASPTSLLMSDDQIIECIFSHIDNKTTDLGKEVWKEPVENYIDQRRFDKEIKLLRSLPVPFCPSSALPEKGSYVSRVAAGTPILVTRDDENNINAFINACRHRGMQVASGSGCKKSFVCPYHGWTFDGYGKLKTLPLKDDFEIKIELGDYFLEEVNSLVNGPLIWINLSKKPISIDDQIELVARKCTYEWQKNYNIFSELSNTLNCNWKIAHDNTLDDYHVAVAHKDTLHKEQGPIKNYKYFFSEFCNVLVTPLSSEDNLYTFGLLPWTHLIIWPGKGILLISYLPENINHCTLEIKLASASLSTKDLEIWKRSILKFLEEDKVIVESVHKSYIEKFKIGPPNKLEKRIIHWQKIYKKFLHASGISF